MDLAILTLQNSCKKIHICEISIINEKERRNLKSEAVYYNLASRAFAQASLTDLRQDLLQTVFTTD